MSVSVNVFPLLVSRRGHVGGILVELPSSRVAQSATHLLTRVVEALPCPVAAVDADFFAVGEQSRCVRQNDGGQAHLAGDDRAVGQRPAALEHDPVAERELTAELGDAGDEVVRAVQRVDDPRSRARARPPRP